jgi:hypothetical protein
MRLTEQEQQEIFAMSKEIEKSKLSCFNRENRIGDHFGDVTVMVSLGSNAKQTVRTIETQIA